MATWWNKTLLLDPMNSTTLNLHMFHDILMMTLLLITFFISYLMITLMINSLPSIKFTHHHLLEITWTILPMIILLFIAQPSLIILYMMDEMSPPLFTLKAIGHQWYWSYEYPHTMFDSMINNNSIFRCLECNNNLIVPTQLPIRMISTSEDVIHAWTIPSLSIKMDSVPGRLNQTELMINNPGMFFGQCSEICGSNHSFMPITMESIFF